MAATQARPQPKARPSQVVDRCQVCAAPDLQPALFLGYLPPVNAMIPIGTRPAEQPAYPAQLLWCRKCQLVQLGLSVDPAILFPPDYPYTSGTTRILRENFADLYRETLTVLPLQADDLIVDIGSNDGTLLGNFQRGGHRVHGIEPTDVAKLASDQGIPTTQAFFTSAVAHRIAARHGQAAVVTAANVFAHVADVHEALRGVLDMLRLDGLFISESHYLMSLLETNQYDTIYHEHLRYYSLQSLQYLLAAHGLEIIHAHRIPTHGGSIRVYAARQGAHTVRPSVAGLLESEASRGPLEVQLANLRRQVTSAKLELHDILHEIKKQGGRVHGIGAPSRATTLIHRVGLDECILDCTLEIRGSLKIGNYIPGTLIPILEESRLSSDRPEYALLFSWHIADELIPKIRSKGFAGKFIIPLPSPRIV